nr:hypothetical protein [Tanacetum cinerariifolium]
EFTQADGAQSSRVPLPLPEDPYEAIRQAYLEGTYTESEPFKGKARTPESPHIVAPPTCHVEESEGSGTSGVISTSSDSTAPLSPDHPLTHITPVLVPIICRTAHIAVRVPPVISPGLSAGIAEVAAMSDSEFRKRFRSSYDSLPSPTLLVRKTYRGTSELILGTDSEEDEEVEESSNFNSESEDVEDKGPTVEDEDPAAEDEGLAAEVEGPGLDNESYGLDDESHGVDGKIYGLDDESRGIDDEAYGIESDRLGLGEEEAVPEGQQRAVSVVGTAVSEPLGLGYGALRRQVLALEEDHVYSWFEVGQGSGSALEAERSDRVSAFRQPTLTTWTDPKDGMIYIDVPVYPPPAPLVQTSPSPEWTSGLLPISPPLSVVPSLVSSPMIPLTVPSPIATLTATILVDEDQFIEVGAHLELYRGILQDHTQRLDAMSPTLFVEIDRDVRELYTRSGAVRDEIFSQRYRVRSLEHEHERNAISSRYVITADRFIVRAAGDEGSCKQRMCLWLLNELIQASCHLLIHQRTTGCALLQKKFKEDLFAYCIENRILQDSSKPSYNNTNVVNALREPFVVNQDLGAHYGYNCPPKVPVVLDQEPFNNQTIDELPQTLPSFDPTCYSRDGNSFTYESTSNLVQDSPNVLSLAWETILEIELAFDNRHCKPEDILELFQRLQTDVQNIHEELAVYINTSNWDRPIICYNDDDDEDYAIAVTPSLSTEEPDNSLCMGDEQFDNVPTTELDEFIKSSVKNLIPIQNQFEDFSNFNDESTSTDDDSFSIDNIKYVEASPPHFEPVSSEVIEIVIPKVGGIDDDILLTIKDDIFREKLLNINLLIANIEALNDNPTPSSDFMTKSFSTSLNSLLEETNIFDNSLLKFETFCFDLEEISSGSTTTRSDISLPDYEVFYDNHVKEISSDSTTTYSDSSLYDSFIFDLSINPFPSADRSDFYEFTDELSHIISPPEYDCFCFKIEPNSGDFTMDVVEDTFPTREPRVHNALPTHPNLQLNLDFILSSESLFAYVVWIFLLFLSYSVAPQYLLSLGNEDTIFDLGIFSYHISSFRPDVSHRSGTFIKFKILNESPMEILFSTCSPMDQ